MPCARRATDIEETRNRLRVELATLKSLARIEGEGAHRARHGAADARSGAPRPRVRPGRHRPRGASAADRGRRSTGAPRPHGPLEVARVAKPFMRPMVTVRGPASPERIRSRGRVSTEVASSALRALMRTRVLVVAAFIACAFVGLVGRLALSPDRQARRVRAARGRAARQDHPAQAQARPDPRPERPGAGRLVPRGVAVRAHLARRGPGRPGAPARADPGRRAEGDRQAARLAEALRVRQAAAAAGHRRRRSSTSTSRRSASSRRACGSTRTASSPRRWSASRAWTARAWPASSRRGTRTSRARRAGRWSGETRSAARSPARPGCSSRPRRGRA